MENRLFIATLEERMQMTSVSGTQMDGFFKALLDGWEKGPFSRYWLMFCEEGNTELGHERFEHLVNGIHEEHDRNDWGEPDIQSLVFSSASFRSPLSVEGAIRMLASEFTVEPGTPTTCVISAPFWGLNACLLNPDLFDRDVVGASWHLSTHFRYFGSRGELDFALGEPVTWQHEKQSFAVKSELMHGLYRSARLTPKDIAYYQDLVTMGVDRDLPERIDPLMLVNQARRTLLESALDGFCCGLTDMHEEGFAEAIRHFAHVEDCLHMLPELQQRKIDLSSTAWIVRYGARFLKVLCEFAIVEDDYADYRRMLLTTWVHALRASVADPARSHEAVQSARQALVAMQSASMFAVGADRIDFESISDSDRQAIYKNRPLLFTDRADDSSRFLDGARLDAPVLSNGRSITEFILATPDEDINWGVADVLQCVQLVGLWLLDETRASHFTVMPCAPDGSPCRTPFDTMPGGMEWMQHLVFLAWKDELI